MQLLDNAICLRMIMNWLSDIDSEESIRLFCSCNPGAAWLGRFNSGTATPVAIFGGKNGNYRKKEAWIQQSSVLTQSPEFCYFVRIRIHPSSTMACLAVL